jgi:hypothetical protein
MTAEDCRIWRERLGALVLGQLAPEERAATEAHLQGCPGCRAEAEALEPLAGVLQRADPERLGAVPAPPPYLGDRVARRITAERRTVRRRRVRTGVALGTAAAVAATVGILLAVVFSGSSETKRPLAHTVTFADLPKDVSVRATLEARPWGSDISIRARGFPPGMLCTVWLRREDGKRISAGSFRYVYSGQADEARLSSGLDPHDVTAIGMNAGEWTYVAPIRAAARGSGTTKS